MVRMSPEPGHPNRRDPASLPRELRRAPVPERVRAWVADATGVAVQSVHRLPGASSTAVHLVRLATGDRVVLRRYVWPGFLEDEPIAPRREVDALVFARRHGLPAPEVVAADVGGVSTGDGVPTILMTLVPGRPVGIPDLRALADVAATIHDVAPDGFPHHYFPWYQDTTTREPASATRPDLWRDAIDRWRDLPNDSPVFIHRDFHPGNVLWSRGRPTGIVDWANACSGPWGCDVAHCRGNLIELSGPEAADRFLAAYEAVTGRVYDLVWEIASVLEHGPSYWTAIRIEQSEQRLERAFRATA